MTANVRRTKPGHDYPVGSLVEVDFWRPVGQSSQRIKGSMFVYSRDTDAVGRTRYWLTPYPPISKNEWLKADVTLHYPYSKLVRRIMVNQLTSTEMVLSVEGPLDEDMVKPGRVRPFKGVQGEGK